MRGRVIVGFGLLVVVLIAVVAGSAWLMKQHQADMVRMERTTATAELLADATQNATLATLFLERYITAGNEGLIPTIQTSIITVTDNLAEAQSQEEARGLEGIPGVDDEAELVRLNEIAAGAVILQATSDEVISLMQSGDVEGARASLEAAIPEIATFGIALSEVNEHEHRKLAILRAHANSASELAFWMLVVTGVIGAAIGLTISALIARSILRPLYSLEATALAVAGGDLNERACTTGPQELARLGASLNSMADSLLDASKRRELEEERHKLSTMVEQSPSLVIMTDLNGDIEYVNPKFTEVTGYTAEEVIGENPRMLSSGETSPEEYKRLWGTITSGGEWKGEFHNKAKSGGFYWVSASISSIRNEEGASTHFLAVQEDITIRKQAEEAIEHLAYHDSLTGLPNRTLFTDRLKLALAQARRNKRALAVMFLDLDRFNIVNDTVGHIEGDKVLRSVGERMTGLMREGDTVARVGGDEFTILLPEISRVEDAVEVAEKILADFRRPQKFHGHEFHVTASIGLTIYPTDGEDVETLLRNADTAMYRAKERGRNNYQLYTPTMNAMKRERLALENDLRHALERKEFVLHYQPQVEIETGEIVGVEALVRWQHPERGLVLPGEFIPVAEETGLIFQIGDWVRRTACNQIRAWQKAGLPPLRLAVNLSARRFQHPGLVESVAQVLNETGLDPHLLELEITESVAMQDTEWTVNVLRDLRDMGVHIAIDDFGTGHSSLGYLRQFPISCVKIDRSFVRDITIDKNDAAIVSAIIALSHSLDLRVVAEGVETEDQLAFLRERQCDEYQGYLFARPVPAKELEKTLAQGKRLEASASGLKSSG